MLFDHQIEKLSGELSKVVDDAIAKLRALLKGIKITITVNIDAHEVKPAEANEEKA